jgi:hypothetical protein
MSTIRSNIRRLNGDHFEPADTLDPKAQRQLRGHLERIDYTAYAANKKVMSAALAGIDSGKFERLAFNIAQARARWVATGVAISESGRPASAEQTAELTRLRNAYEEFAEVYEAMRRMVERGYIEVPAS